MKEIVKKCSTDQIKNLNCSILSLQPTFKHQSAKCLQPKKWVKNLFNLHGYPPKQPTRTDKGLFLQTQVRNIWVFLLSFPQNERKIYYFCSVCIFFQGIVFTFQILNDRIHNYVVFFDIIVNFIIQKLKSKRTSLNIQTEQN